MLKKIVGISRLRSILKTQGSEGVVFTNGCFDILHYGHVKYLCQARAKGRLLVVGLNSDSSVRRLKGEGRPVTPQKDRAGILAALACVDYVVVFEEDTPYRLIKALKPEILVKGADWAGKEIIGAGIVAGRGGKVLTVPYSFGRSTTGILKKLDKTTTDAYRVIDANLNRCKEGLRVCEEVSRFHLASAPLTKRFKVLRHGLTVIVRDSRLDLPKLLAARDTQGDRAKKSCLYARKNNLKDIFMANAQRVKEAVRVLEEFLKLFDRTAAKKIQKLRFDFYALEKETIAGFPALSYSG